MLSLTVELAASSDDSFSSRADNSYNKGAAEFLALVEEHCRKNKEAMSRSEQFASLAIQMMDLSLDKKLPTSTRIPSFMNVMGWNVR